MGLMKCPDCGHKVSENAEKCPNCGCPNNGNYIKLNEKTGFDPTQYIDIIQEKLNFKKRSSLAICAVVAFAIIFVAFRFVFPSEKGSPFYNAKTIDSEQVLKMYGEPDDIDRHVVSYAYGELMYVDSFEYTYNGFSFMNVSGELVFSFDGDEPSDDIEYITWDIDRSQGYKDKTLEKICKLYDRVYGKREVTNDDYYEWNTTNSDITFYKSACRFIFYPYGF